MQQKSPSTNTESERHPCSPGAFCMPVHNNPHAVPLSTHSVDDIASDRDGVTWAAGQVVGTSHFAGNSSLLGAVVPIGLPAARTVGSHPVAHVRRLPGSIPPEWPANGSPQS
jgi:hypothetical protein